MLLLEKRKFLFKNRLSVCSSSSLQKIILYFRFDSFNETRDLRITQWDPYKSLETKNKTEKITAHPTSVSEYS